MTRENDLYLVKLAAAFDSVTKVGVVIDAVPPAEVKDHLLWLQPLLDGSVILWMGWKGQWDRISDGMPQ